MDYGYIRVSTKEQNEDRQTKSNERFVFMDKQNGKDFNRPA